MAKFRKRPVVIDAIQFFNGTPFPAGVCDCSSDPRHSGTPHIHTLEGIHDVSESDWIITGVKGEKYPVKDEIFKMTYESVAGED